MLLSNTAQIIKYFLIGYVTPMQPNLKLFHTNKIIITGRIGNTAVSLQLLPASIGRLDHARAG
jgi:hypothetical protein